jgi:hypothetical protein
MTMSNREWDLLVKIDSSQVSMLSRLVVIEDQVMCWRKRERIVFKIGVSLLAGLAVWFCTGHYPL